MSRKYIKEQIIQDFVYPNNEKDQYDIEIVHDINNNCVSGDINTFSATTTNQTGITIQYSFDWDTNGAELFQMDNGNYSYISVHMMAPTQTYFKPFRVAFNIESSTLYTGTTTFTGSTTVLPENLGEDLFSNGTYYYEVRFIGHRCIYPVCGSFTVSGITPGPTPTPTATPTPTTTSTPTPTSTPTATPTATPTEDLNINAKYINNEAILQYDVNGGSTQTLGNIDSLTCQYFFTITGLTNGDILQFYTQGTNAINGSTTDCPNTTFCLTLSYTFTGTTTIYITVDGSVSC